MVGIKPIQTDVLQYHFGHFLSEDVRSVAPVEIKAVTHFVGLPAGTLVADKQGVIGVLRRNPQSGYVLKRPTLVLPVNKLPAHLVGQFGLSTFRIFPLYFTGTGISDGNRFFFLSREIGDKYNLIRLPVAVQIDCLAG